MESIDKAISNIVWMNDRNTSSEDARVLAILHALNEIANQLNRIANKLEEKK